MVKRWAGGPETGGSSPLTLTKFYMKYIETAAVIPAHNEEAGIERVIKAAAHAELVDCIVIVDDGSQDATYESVLHTAAEISTKPVEVVRHDTNLGKTEAVASGVERARSIGGTSLQTLVFLDADSLPIWSRDTLANMKLWQRSIHQLLGLSRVLLPDEVTEGRNDYFISLLSRYIDEIVEPVANERQEMRTGMYQRNTFTDTFMPHISSRGGHAGNRALTVDLWNKFLSVRQQNKGVAEWGLEAGLNALIGEEDTGTFVMYGVVNVGSRIKAGGSIKGLKRMIKIHAQAPLTRATFRR